jgi:hypothetical protein
MSASQLSTILVPAACDLRPATCNLPPAPAVPVPEPATCNLPPATCHLHRLSLCHNLNMLCVPHGQLGPGGLSQHPPPGGTECLRQKQARSDELLVQDTCMAKYAHVFPIRWSPILPATHISWISPKFIISENTSSKNSSKCLRVCFSSTLCAPRQL